MSKLKIALFDLRHKTMGLHSYQMPLGIGLIAAYLSKYLNQDVDIRLYRYVESFFKEISDWQPHIVGASCFSWNRKLTLWSFEKVKMMLPNTITVLGGPELEIKSQKRLVFLESHPYVDMCCFGEGEETFLEIVKSFSSGVLFKQTNNLEGTFFLRKDGSLLVENSWRERISSLDDIPSPYIEGFFEPFFDEYLHPFVETSRGCPFRCGFCYMGIKENSRVTFQSIERSMSDLEYCADRYRGRHDIQLCIGDNNFGMFEKDVSLSKEIRKLQDQYDWPRFFVMNTGKNAKEKLVKISKTLKWGLPFNMAFQSMNPDTLEVIGRKNISISEIIDTVDQVKNQEEDSSSELIIGLPLDTRHSFENALKEIISLDLNWICIYSLNILTSTWLADEDIQKKYEIGLKYRIVPRQVGYYDGRRIIETIPSVVSTSTLSFEDYCYLRELTFIIQIIYNSDSFNLIRRVLRENNCDVWKWIQNVHSLVKGTKGKMKDQLDAFVKETKEELFSSDDEISKFFDDNKNYKKLVNGEICDNLINKYTVLASSDAFVDWLIIASLTAKQLLEEVLVDADFINGALVDIERYIQLTFNFTVYFFEIPRIDQCKTVEFCYDVAKWAISPDLKLSECVGKTQYNVFFTEEKITQIKNLVESSHDISFTIQRVFRDKSYADLIPKIVTAV